MKTSNKLLIALAALLIIVPIVVIAINVKTNGINKKTFRKQMSENKNLNAALDGFEIIKLSKFTSINLNNGNNAYISFDIIKSKESGIKIPEGLAEQYDITIDNHQTLQIKLTHPEKKLKHAVNVYIYADDIKLLNIQKASGFRLNITNDSLAIHAKDINQLDFDQEAHISNLNLSVKSVKSLSFYDNKTIQNLDLTLNDSNFSTSKSFFKILNINATGKSDIDIYGDREDINKYQIESLFINTVGTTNLKLQNIKINKSEGSLSDSTDVSMPAFILKTMIK